MITAQVLNICYWISRVS